MDLHIPPNEFEDSEKSIAEPPKKSTLFSKMSGIDFGDFDILLG